MSKFIDKILNEAAPIGHFYERLSQRLNVNMFDVGVETTPGNYSVIGQYFMPQSFQKQVLDNAQIVEATQFPYGRAFAIKLGQLKIDSSKIDFPSLTQKKMLVNAKNPPVMVDRESNSNGDVVYAIVRDNKIITFYWGKSYVAQTKEKMRVDMVINDIEVLRQMAKPQEDIKIKGANWLLFHSNV